jgi:branched-subunit amino acid transport protein
MQTSTLIWIIVLSGVGTYLIRLLPMLWQENTTRTGVRPGNLRYALDAVGPSAIVALLVVAFWGMLTPTPSWSAALPIVAGLSGVWLGKVLLKTIAWATLSGVLAYGAMIWMLG